MAVCVFGVERVCGQDNNGNSYFQKSVPAGEEALGSGAGVGGGVGREGARKALDWL